MPNPFFYEKERHDLAWSKRVLLTANFFLRMKRIYLIDCPGVVPPNANDSEQDILLRGVVRVENVENPHVYIPAVLKKTKPQHIERTYNVKDFNNATEFLELLARKAGRLLKGGEADVDGVAKMVLNDFLRGKIPWFTPPPLLEGQEEKEKGIEGRKGALGEMGRKRKADDAFTEDDTIAATVDESMRDEQVAGDPVDPVIAEPTSSEVIPENIPNGGSDFESFDEDDDEDSEVDSDTVLSDGDDEGNESHVEEGGASLVEPDDLLGGDLDEGDDSENNGLDDGHDIKILPNTKDVKGLPLQKASYRQVKRKKMS